MTEQELYERVLVLRKKTDEVLDDALALPPTVELCVFIGKVSAVFDVLCTLEAAGVPVHDPDEEPHLLAPGRCDG